MITKELFEEALFGLNDYYVVNYSYESDSGKLLDFAIIYLCKHDDKKFEIVRFDCSSREPFHVHKFFSSGKSKKIFIQKDNCFETVEWCIAELKDKWFKYKISYFEGKD